MRPPRVVNSRGVKYALTLLKVVARDAFGRPTDTRIVYDEEVLEEVMNDAERASHRVEFILIYATEDEVRPKVGGVA